MAAKKRSTKLKAWRVAYKAEGRKLKNKNKKVAKHLMRHPNDTQSAERKVPDYRTKAKKAYVFGTLTNVKPGQYRDERQVKA